MASKSKSGHGYVLLGLNGYIADRHNRTTASSTTSTGLPIEVTFCAARPPALAHFSIHCPGLDHVGADRNPLLSPKVLSADADVVLIRVPVDPLALLDLRLHDYFVYRMHPETPRLDLLPHPGEHGFSDSEIAILSCCNGKYVVAGLQATSCDTTYTLRRLYRDGEPPGVGVGPPSVCPSIRQTHHLTAKVITLRGARGTIGWVDLWRGILLCDVLDATPKVRDIPLPFPARANWRAYLNRCPYYSRDITVSESRDTIKYVEMELTRPAIEEEIISGPDDPEEECSYSLVPGRWQATTWTMPIPANSWNDWKYGCTISSDHVMSRNERKEEVAVAGLCLSLGCLRMVHPTLSIADGDDVIYLLSKGIRGAKMAAVVAVDVRARTLIGVSEIDSEKNINFLRCCLPTGIFKHLNTSAAT
ncbi:hypothetical protein OsI_23035 [Oryza sativa Indica Group]|uniref:DUF1618 domain-containing protein n=1 Tax=Oryza sativa subsp. indica TaxID=39946 RepID=B8B2V7_ORYSI|nr:hypothetical protein OsI_23035 [Oryza sativa Indica Group]